MKSNPKVLYHYCSVENMFNILESKSIWLSNSNQMNDSEESKWVERYFHLIKEIFSGKDYEEIVENSIKNYEFQLNNPFIFCLSEKKDILSQWRAYAADGQGVAIGFSTEKLDIPKILPSHELTSNITLGLNKIIYNPKKQESNMLEFLLKMKKEYDEIEGSRAIASFRLGNELVERSLLFKNNSFKEEKEWRIIYTPKEDNYKLETDLEPQISDRKFRVSNHKLISYHKLDLKEKFDSQLISRIILGPKTKIKISELLTYLNHHNLRATNILTSKSTYQ